jgi:hypothetical protein
VLHQRPKFLVGQRCELQQACVQPLEFTLGHRVEIDAPDTFLGPWALQPTKQDLGGARITDRALTQTTFDLRVTRRLALSTRRTRGRVIPASESPAFAGCNSPSTGLDCGLGSI